MTRNLFFFTALAAFTMLAGCRKYDDSAVRGRLDDHEQRLAALESAVAALDAQIKAGAMIKSVTPIATGAGGWRIEFTGGSPSSIDILNGATGAQGTPGTTPATPQIEVRTGADGSVSLWYKTDGDWTDTGVNIKGEPGDPGSPGTPGTPGKPGTNGVSPQVRVMDNGDGTVTIRYNTTAGYPAGGWTNAGTPIALDSNPRDKEAILSIVDNGATGTITITMNDDNDPHRSFEFAKASGAARIELVGFNDKVTIAEGRTARIRFVVNPSDAYVPLDKWELNQTGTRAGYVTAPTDFVLVGVAPASSDPDKKGEYLATIRCLTHNPAITDYAMSLVLNTGTAAAPSLVSSPTFVLGTAAPPPVASGQAGDDITWVLSADGTLTFTGTGAMSDYDNAGNRNPWYSYRGTIKKVVIPDGVTSIGSRAFDYCHTLTEITIPDSVKSIGEYAFNYCFGLTKVTIGDGVETIASGAFNRCWTFTEITLPAGVKTIGSGAFGYCNALANVTCLAAAPPTLAGGNFSVNRTDVLHVPAGSLANYQGVAAWKDAFTSIEEIP